MHWSQHTMQHTYILFRAAQRKNLEYKSMTTYNPSLSAM